MSLSRSLPVAISILALSQGCALDPGEAFGEVDGSLAVELESRGRIDEDGWLRTVGSYEVRLDSLEVEVFAIRLVDTTGGAGDGESFDPTSPPPGWLCHGDHCHTPEGELVSYDEAAVMLGGGPAGPMTLLTFLVEAALEPLSEGENKPLVECSPSCLLGRSSADMIAVDLERISLQGVARDRLPENRLEEETVPILVDVAACESSISSRLEDPIVFDRGLAPLVSLDLALLLHPSILDGIELGALQDDGEIRIELGHEDRLVPDAAALILENLEDSRVEASILRTER